MGNTHVSRVASNGTVHLHIAHGRGGYVEMQTIEDEKHHTTDDNPVYITDPKEKDINCSEWLPCEGWFPDNAHKLGEPLKVDMYALWAIVGAPMCPCTSSAKSSCCSCSITECYRCIVCLVQLFGPPLLISRLCEMDRWKSLQRELFSPVHLLAVLLLVLLGMKSLYAISRDRESLDKCAQLIPVLKEHKKLRYSLTIEDLNADTIYVSEKVSTLKLDVSKPQDTEQGRTCWPCSIENSGPASPCLFLVGAMINIYVAWCGLLVIFLNYLQEGDPVDYVFNALAFSFMQNLDHPDGDFGMGVVSESDWSAAWMGHLWTLNCSNRDEFQKCLLSQIPASLTASIISKELIIKDVPTQPPDASHAKSCAGRRDESDRSPVRTLCLSAGVEPTHQSDFASGCCMQRKPGKEKDDVTISVEPTQDVPEWPFVVPWQLNRALSQNEKRWEKEAKMKKQDMNLDEKLQGIPLREKSRRQNNGCWWMWVALLVLRVAYGLSVVIVGVLPISYCLLMYNYHVELETVSASSSLHSISSNSSTRGPTEVRQEFGEQFAWICWIPTSVF